MNKAQVGDRLIEEIKQRRGMGLKKYGVLLKDAPLSRKELLQHAKEEALDLAEYLQTLIDMESDPNADRPAWPETRHASVAGPDWPETEERIENIGPNGNDGDHYETIK